VVAIVIALIGHRIGRYTYFRASHRSAGSGAPQSQAVIEVSRESVARMERD
jgi:hypothetical protein